MSKKKRSKMIWNKLERYSQEKSIIQNPMLSLTKLIESFDTLQVRYGSLIHEEKDFYEELKGGELFILEKEYDYWSLLSDDDDDDDDEKKNPMTSLLGEYRCLEKGTIMMYISQKVIDPENSRVCQHYFMPMWLIEERVVKVSLPTFTLRRIKSKTDIDPVEAIMKTL